MRLRPGDPPAPTLGLVAAVALDETVSAHAAGAPLSIKWPNDLLLGRAKLAGILLERVGDAIAAGFGVNCAAAPVVPGRETTSLAASGHPTDPAVLVETLAEAFARWLARWRGEGLASVRTRWLERAHPLGTALSVHAPDGQVLDGLFDGLDLDGALILRLADGRRHAMHAGDVFLI